MYRNSFRHYSSKLLGLTTDKTRIILDGRHGGNGGPTSMRHASRRIQQKSSSGQLWYHWARSFQVCQRTQYDTPVLIQNSLHAQVSTLFWTFVLRGREEEMSKEDDPVMRTRRKTERDETGEGRCGGCTLCFKSFGTHFTVAFFNVEARNTDSVLYYKRYMVPIGYTYYRVHRINGRIQKNI